MASSVTTTESVTQVEYKEIVKEEEPKTPTLQLKPVKQDKTIKWAEGTVDNEGMGKKSSKCCCIYKKPRAFGESSSEDESSDEDDKCKGPKDYHKKAKKAKHKKEHDENCNC